jgi:hypothetical protein
MWALGWGRPMHPVRKGEKAPVWNNWTDPWLIEDPVLCDLKGHSVGLRTGVRIDPKYLVGIGAIDIDVSDPALSQELADTIEAMLRAGGATGIVIRRTGKYPKIMLIVRMELKPDFWENVFRLPVIRLGDGKGQIEFQGTKKQIVVVGDHPDTKKPYVSAPDIMTVMPHQLLHVTQDELVQIWTTLSSAYGTTPVSTSGTAGTGVFQPSLDVNSLIDDLLNNRAPMHETLAAIIMSRASSGWTEEEVRTEAEDIASRIPRLDRDRLQIGVPRGELDRLITGAIQKTDNDPRVKHLRRERTEGNGTPQDDFGAAPLVLDTEDDPFAPVSETDIMVERLVKKYGTPQLKMSSWNFVSTSWDIDPKTFPLVPFIDKAHDLTKGRMSLLAGDPGVTKSAFALDYILHLMTGEGNYGSGVEDPCGQDGLKVCIVSADDPVDLTQARALAFALWWAHGDVVKARAILGKINGRLHVLGVGDGAEQVNLRDRMSINKLLDYVDKHGIIHIEVDPFTNVSGAEDANSSAEINKSMEYLRAECAKRGVSVRYAHHTRKPPPAAGAGKKASEHEASQHEVMGSTALVGAVRDVLTMRRCTPKEIAGLEHDLGPGGAFGVGKTGVGDLWRWVKLECVKTNMRAKAEVRYFYIASQGLGNGVAGRPETEMPVLVRVFPAVAAGASAADMQAVLDTVLDYWNAGRPLTVHHSKDGERHVVRALNERLGLDEVTAKDRVQKLLKEGYIEEAEGPKYDNGTGRGKKGFKVKQGRETYVSQDDASSVFGYAEDASD